MSELRRCPFCGGERIEYIPNVQIQGMDDGYKCKDCYMIAIEVFWNKRPIEDELKKQVKQSYVEAFKASVETLTPDAQWLNIDKAAEKSWNASDAKKRLGV